MTLPQLTGNEESLRWDRLAEAYDEGQLGQVEIQRTRARIDARASRRQRSKMSLVLVAGLQGFAIGLVTLGAGAWVTEKVLLSETHVTASAPREAVKPPAASPSRPNGTVAARAAASPPAEPPSAAFGDVAEPGAGVGAAPPAAAPAANGVAPSPPVGLGDVPQLEAPQDGPWKRVAAALAANDLSRADWELSALVTSTDPATRDAAELARAQIAISAGRGGATAGALKRLAGAGSTPLIRKRAAELLSRLGGGQ